MIKFGVYAGFLKVSPKIKTFVCNVLPDTTLYPAFRRPPRLRLSSFFPTQRWRTGHISIKYLSLGQTRIFYYTCVYIVSFFIILFSNKNKLYLQLIYIHYLLTVYTLLFLIYCILHYYLHYILFIIS